VFDTGKLVEMLLIWSHSLIVNWKRMWTNRYWFCVVRQFCLLFVCVVILYCNAAVLAFYRLVITTTKVFCVFGSNKKLYNRYFLIKHLLTVKCLILCILFAPSCALLYMLIRRCIFQWPRHGWRIKCTVTLMHLASSLAFQGSESSA